MEVQAKLEPLRQAVESQGRTLRSLYSNGSGGPPGYLERAREEDREWKNGMLEKLDSFFERLGKVETFVVAHEAIEARAVQEKKELNRKLNIKLAIAGLVFTGISFIASNMQGCKSAARSFLSDQTTKSPIDASVPAPDYKAATK